MKVGHDPDVVAVGSVPGVVVQVTTPVVPPGQAGKGPAAGHGVQVPVTAPWVTGPAAVHGDQAPKVGPGSKPVPAGQL